MGQPGPSTAEVRARARAVTEVIYALNREFSQRVGPAQLAAADSILRAVITGDGALQSAASAIRPPAATGSRPVPGTPA